MRCATDQTEAFEEWLDSLSAKEEALVRARLARIVDDGHFGDCKGLGEGLNELRWKNGIRVYFIRVSVNKILLLLGGFKNDQKKDIKKARRMF